jgi:hypothetical protein
MVTLVRSGFCIALLTALALGTFQARGAENFVRVPFGDGVSVEVPGTWVVLSGDRRVSVAAYVAAGASRKNDPAFAAHLHDERGRTRGLVNVLFSPRNTATQADVRELTAEDMKSLDVELRTLAERPLKAMGTRMTRWYGSTIRVINGLHVLVHEHETSGIGDAGPTRVRGLRVWSSPRSFTVMLSYRESDAKTLLPVIDHMTASVRQE